MGTEKCLECSGSGRAEPNCEFCKGCGTVTEQFLIENNYSPEDCEIWDDYGDSGETIYKCPECHDETCMTCMGDGVVANGFAAEEKIRVLLTALNRHNDVYPRLGKDFQGRTKLNYDAYLSSAVARDLEKDGKIRWFCNVFGDELSLTDIGEAEVMRLFDDGTSRFLMGYP